MKTSTKNRFDLCRSVIRTRQKIKCSDFAILTKAGIQAGSGNMPLSRIDSRLCGKNYALFVIYKKGSLGSIKNWSKSPMWRCFSALSKRSLVPWTSHATGALYARFCKPAPKTIIVTNYFGNGWNWGTGVVQVNVWSSQVKGPNHIYAGDKSAIKL